MLTLNGEVSIFVGKELKEKIELKRSRVDKRKRKRARSSSSTWAH